MNAKQPMAKYCINRQSGWRVTIWAGVIAGTLATLIQVLLWLVFTDDFPAILYRDARLTAAMVLGGSVLPPPATFDVGIMLAATLVHFALSIVYAALLAPLTVRLGDVLALLAGAVFGVALYIYRQSIRLHGDLFLVRAGARLDCFDRSWGIRGDGDLGLPMSEL